MTHTLKIPIKFSTSIKKITIPENLSMEQSKIERRTVIIITFENRTHEASKRVIGQKLLYRRPV